MAITPASFKDEFPEFALVSDVRIQAKLDSAALEIGEAWGAQQDAATKQLAAHLLWLSPMSEPSKRSASAVSPYIAELDRMRTGARVDFFGTVAGEDLFVGDEL